MNNNESNLSTDSDDNLNAVTPVKLDRHSIIIKYLAMIHIIFFGIKAAIEFQTDNAFHIYWPIHIAFVFIVFFIPRKNLKRAFIIRMLYVMTVPIISLYRFVPGAMEADTGMGQWILHIGIALPLLLIAPVLYPNKAKYIPK